MEVCNWPNNRTERRFNLKMEKNMVSVLKCFFSTSVLILDCDGASTDFLQTHVRGAVFALLAVLVCFPEIIIALPTFLLSYFSLPWYKRT